MNRITYISNDFLSLVEYKRRFYHKPRNEMQKFPSI